MSKIPTILAQALRVTLGFVTRKQSRVQQALPSACVAPARHQRKSLLHGQQRLRRSERPPHTPVPQSPQTRILKSPLPPGLSKSSRERRYRDNIARAFGSAGNRILLCCLSRKCAEPWSRFTPKVAFRDDAGLWVNCEVCSRGSEGRRKAAYNEDGPEGSLSSATVGTPGDVHTQIGSFNEAEVLCSPNWVPGGNLSGVS